MQTQQAAPGEVGANRPTAERLDQWLTPGRFALILGALVFVSFPQVVLGLETFVFRDFGFFSYPLAHFQRDCFWRGELPFWNPYNNCGVPFLAQWNTMPLYPAALIYLLLPLGWSLSFFCLFHLVFAGIGMYALAHRWTKDRLGASVAGLVFAFNGLSLNLLMWPSQIATLSWMPWVVLAVESARQQNGGGIILAGLAGALQMLCGGPEIILFTWMLVAGLWVVGPKSKVQSPKSEVASQQSIVHGPQYRVPRPAQPNEEVQNTNYWLRTGLRLGVIVLIVFGLSAAQVLPFLDFVRHSQRGHHFLDLRWAMPSRGWANFLVPMVFESVGEAGVWFQNGQYWTSSYYIGVVTVLLGLLAVWKIRERRVWLLSAITVGAFVLALGEQTRVYGWLRWLIPALSSMTFPVKFVILIAFTWPLLAAGAVAHLRRARLSQSFNLQRRAAPDAAQPERVSNPVESKAPMRSSIEMPLLLTAAVLTLLIAFIVAWARVSPLPLDDFGVTLRNGVSRAVFVALAALVLILLARSSSARQQRIWSLSLLMLMWLDVWTHTPQQNPTAPAAVYQSGLVRTELAMHPQPGLGRSRVMVSPWANDVFDKQHPRVTEAKNGYFAARLGFFTDCNLLDEVPKVNGFFSVYPYECDQLTQLLYISTNASYPRLADFLCVSHITAPGECTVWQPRASYLPAITAGQQPTFLDDTNAIRRLIRSDFDGSKMVFLPAEEKALVSVTNHTDAQVLSQKFGREVVEAEVQASAPSMVTFSQTYYHCWRAYVDNRSVPLLRANFAFQAVQVPAGRHHVRLAYEERGFRIGAIISILTALGCVVWSPAFRRLVLRKMGSRDFGGLAR